MVPVHIKIKKGKKAGSIFENRTQPIIAGITINKLKARAQ
jgi:hypothetical protein